MTLDQRLSEAVHRIADEVAVPEVDLIVVRTRARASRRRTVGAVVVAVVAVIAAGAVVMSGRQTSAPEPVRPPHVEAQVPVWYDAAGLHYGTLLYPTPVDLFDHEATDGNTGVLTLVRRGALYRDSATDDVWFHPWDGDPRVVGHDSPTGPAGDPHSDVAAWFEHSELVVYDTYHGREISRTKEPPAIDYSGHDHVNGGNGFKHVSTEEVVWRSADTFGSPTQPAMTRMHRLDLATGASTVLSATPMEGVQWHMEDVHDHTRVWINDETDGLSVEVDGRPKVPLPDLEPIGRLSADGSFLLSPWSTDDSQGAAVVDVRTGARWNMLDDKFYAWISWTYGDLALVLVEREHGEDPLLACDAVKRTCAELPYQGPVLLPTS